MNKLFKLSVVTLLLTFGLQAQAQNQENSIPPCQGDTLQTNLRTEMLTFFNQSGININHYKWDNSDINCHINSAVDDHDHYKFNMQIGTYGISAGGSAIGIGVISKLALGSGVGWMVVGTACVVGGVYVISRGSKRKKSRDAHVGTIARYYRAHNIQ